MILKKFSLLFLSLVLPASTLGRSLAEIKKSGSVKLAAEGTLVPFNFYQNAKLSGFEVELADLLFARLGVKTDWQTQAFQSLLIGLQNSRYDAVVASLAVTPEREKAVRFVNPHYCSGPVLLSAVGGPKSESDLKGKTTAAKVGTIYFKFLSGIKNLKSAQSLPSNADLIQALVTHRVDAILVNEFAAQNMMKAHTGIAMQIGDKLMEEKLAIAVAKDNSSLQEALNNELRTALNDGSYTKLSMKYFNRDIRCSK
jgi:polar amino acid transport system substrate-binding protein